MTDLSHLPVCDVCGEPAAKFYLTPNGALVLRCGWHWTGSLAREWKEIDWKTAVVSLIQNQ